MKKTPPANKRHAPLAQEDFIQKLSTLSAYEKICISKFRQLYFLLGISPRDNV